MLLQRCTHYVRIKYKQMLDHRIFPHSLQITVVRSFYGDNDIIKFFTRYLRQRAFVTETPFDKFQKKPKYQRFTLFKLDAFNKYDFWTLNWGEWWKHKKTEIYKMLEEFQYEQSLKLGADIAAANFVIQFKGKVKFRGHPEWIDKTKKEEVSKIPQVYDPNYILEGLDLNGYGLRYEHLHYIFGLYYLKHLSFKGCNTIDDWCLDKIVTEYPMLEYLDISECENITERGLEALYKMPNLKKITVTNYHGTAAFDLTCLMLEDVNPHLTCEIQQPKYKVLPAFN